VLEDGWLVAWEECATGETQQVFYDPQSPDTKLLGDHAALTHIKARLTAAAEVEMAKDTHAVAEAVAAAVIQAAEVQAAASAAALTRLAKEAASKSVRSRAANDHAQALAAGTRQEMIKDDAAAVALAASAAAATAGLATSPSIAAATTVMLPSHSLPLDLPAPTLPGAPSTQEAEALVQLYRRVETELGVSLEPEWTCEISVRQSGSSAGSMKKRYKVVESSPTPSPVVNRHVFPVDSHSGVSDVYVTSSDAPALTPIDTMCTCIVIFFYSSIRTPVSTCIMPSDLNMSLNSLEAAGQA
jgi:hypothetical protein